jgi:hypothetical protein
MAFVDSMADSQTSLGEAAWPDREAGKFTKGVTLKQSVLETLDALF